MIRFRNLGTVIGFDLPDKSGRKICDIIVTYKPVKNDWDKFTATIELKKTIATPVDPHSPFYYDVTTETIESPIKEVKTSIANMIEEKINSGFFDSYLKVFSDLIEEQLVKLSVIA